MPYHQIKSGYAPVCLCGINHRLCKQLISKQLISKQLISNQLISNQLISKQLSVTNSSINNSSVNNLKQWQSSWKGMTPSWHQQKVVHSSWVMKTSRRNNLKQWFLSWKGMTPSWCCALAITQKCNVHSIQQYL